MSSTDSDSPRRRPKGDKRERTRAALLEAARSLVREKGYERTTLEAVAQRAGMTTGAIYGNFKNRNELFIALGVTYWAPVRPKVAAGASLAEAMRALAAATIEALADREAAAVGRLTGIAHALTNDDLRARVLEVTTRSFDVGADWLRGFDPLELPMPPDQLVRVLYVLIEGLVTQRLLTPELYPDEVFYAAFAALARPPARGPHD